MNNEDIDRIKGFGEIEEEITHPEIHFCSFMVGNKKLSIPIEVVKEITDPTDLLPLPGSPDYIKGLFHLRGNVIPVVNVAEIYNTKYNFDSEKKLIIIEIEDESIALLSDGMPDLLEDQEGEPINMESFYNKYKVV